MSKSETFICQKTVTKSNFSFLCLSLARMDLNLENLDYTLRQLLIGQDLISGYTYQLCNRKVVGGGLISSMLAIKFNFLWQI